MDIHDDDLPRLCAELRTILAAELDAGNRLARFTGSPDEWPLLVVLSDPFSCSHDPTPDVLRFREVNNPSLWKAHYVCLEHAQIVACGFGDGE
jgi:hypothetical protein